MALRTILEFPDPRLRTRAQPVTRFDAELGRLIDDMFETMYAAPGIGLAATQIDVHKRVIVIDVSGGRSGQLVFINPEILTREGVADMEEGCLSVPGYFDEVERAAKMRLRAQDRNGVAVRARLRRDARGVRAARDGSPRRQAVRRLSVRPEARARPQEARQGAQGKSEPVDIEPPTARAPTESHW